MIGRDTLDLYRVQPPERLGAAERAELAAALERCRQDHDHVHLTPGGQRAHARVMALTGHGSRLSTYLAEVAGLMACDPSEGGRSVVLPDDGLARQARAIEITADWR